MNVAKEMLFAFAEKKKQELDLEIVYLVSGERGVRIARADKGRRLYINLFSFPSHQFLKKLLHRERFKIGNSQNRFPKPRSESEPSRLSMCSPSERNPPSR